MQISWVVLPAAAPAEVTPHPRDGDGIGVDPLVLPGRGFLPIAGMANGLVNVGGDGVGGRLTGDTSHQL